MKTEAISFLSANKEVLIHGKIWYNDTPKAIIHLVHGMVEHHMRYEDMAKALVAQGYLVLACDHAGHGMSLDAAGHKGYFGSHDGWQCLVEDVRAGHDIVTKQFESLPYFIFGHSMGSFVVRSYQLKYHDHKGCILCGTGNDKKGFTLAINASKLLVKFKGATTPSYFLAKQSTGKFNKYFKPNQTYGDWITRDYEELHRQAKDPLGGFVFSTQGYHDMFKGIMHVLDKKTFKAIDKHIPILIISGADDPLGNFGKGIEKLYQTYKTIGVKDVSMKLYPNARHELTHELNKEEFFADIIDWINRKNK